MFELWGGGGGDQTIKKLFFSIPHSTFEEIVTKAIVLSALFEKRIAKVLYCTKKHFFVHGLIAPPPPRSSKIIIRTPLLLVFVNLICLFVLNRTALLLKSLQK